MSKSKHATFLKVLDLIMGTRIYALVPIIFITLEKKKLAVILFSQKLQLVLTHNKGREQKFIG